MMNSSMKMPSVDKRSCFQPILTLFQLYGINLNQSPSRCHRWVSFARSVMLYSYTSSFSFVAFILGYSLVHRMLDISQVCLWTAIQSLVITSFVFYGTSLRQQSTIADFFGKLEQVMAMSADDEAKVKQDFRFLRRLCIWISGVGLAAQVLKTGLSGYETYLGRFHVTVSKPVFHLLGYPVRTADFDLFWLFVSTVYQLLACTFSQLYASAVLVVCLALNVCLHNIGHADKDSTFLAYHRKHREVCLLIRQADSLFSLFLFITLIRDVVITVLMSRMLKSTSVVWDAIYVVPVMVASFVSLCAHTYCSSQVNEKVYSSLDTPPSVGSSDSDTNEDCIRHLVYIARLSSNKVGLTMWGFFIISKGLIFTTIGTMVTYIIILWQFG